MPGRAERIEGRRLKKLKQKKKIVEGAEHNGERRTLYILERKGKSQKKHV